MGLYTEHLTEKYRIPPKGTQLKSLGRYLASKELFPIFMGLSLDAGLDELGKGKNGI